MAGRPSIYQYYGPIATKLRECLSMGMNLTQTHNSCKSYSECPPDIKTFGRIYKIDIEEARSEYQTYLHTKAKEFIDKGSEKVLVKALEAKGGWKEEITLSVEEGKADESSDAVEVLVGLLAKKKKDKEESLDD